MNNHLTKALGRAALLLMLLLPTAGFALELDDAKAQGLVGEDAGGYLSAVSDKPTGEVKALIEDINGKRQAEYQRIAQKNAIELNQVEQLAGKKAIEKTESGHYVRLPGQSWQKKP